jgi:hypothetical protein
VGRPISRPQPAGRSVRPVVTLLGVTPMQSPSADHLKAIYDATNNLLITHSQYSPLLDEPSAIIDLETASAWLAVDRALARLERTLNLAREPYSPALAIRPPGSGWPQPVLTALAVLLRVVYGLVGRWDVPEICEGRTIQREYIPGERMPPRHLMDRERERLEWALQQIAPALATAAPPPAVERTPRDAAGSGGEDQPEAGNAAVMSTEGTPLSRTLDILRGTSKAKNLVKYLHEQTAWKATLREVTRCLYSKGHEPTAGHYKAARQLIRRTAKSLAAGKAPLRIEYDWVRDEISLSDDVAMPVPA